MRLLTLAVAAVLLCAACSRAPEPRAVQPPVMEGESIRFPADSPQLAVLRSETVTEARMETLQLPGRVVWDETRTVRVFPPLAGRVARLLAQPGDAVQAGTPLATMASPELGQAQAEARRSATDLGLAEKNLARATELHEHGVIALKEVQTAQAERDRAASERSRAQARLKVYGASDQADQEFAIRSPIGGVVVERNANPGQELRPDAAQPGTPAVFVVTDPTRLWIQIDAPESAIGALKRGAELRLQSPVLGDRVPRARIEQVSDFFDPQTRTVRVRASIDNSARLLKAEMYVTAEIDIDRGSYVKVPASAIMLRGETQYVFIDEGQGRYRRQQVKAEEAGFGVMRVRSGLKGSEQVVTEGGLMLMVGSPGTELEFAL